MGCASVQVPIEQVQVVGTRYNVPILNALVLYVGMQAISMLQQKPGPSPVVDSPPMEIFQVLLILQASLAAEYHHP